MAPLHRFARYSLVGLGNTVLHAAVFVALHGGVGLSQTRSNLAGFLAAASLSFCLNARFTFQTYRSWRRYWVFMAFMALLSLVIGALGDAFAWLPAVTIVVFSASSLVIGYLFCKRVVFAGGQS